MSNEAPHPGGNREFWADEIVERYEYQQNLHSEKKAERLELIVRIINHFCSLNSISSPSVLDIGCGPGTATTLTRYVLEGVPGSSVTGIDSSGQMLEASVSRLGSEYGKRFTGYLADFNSDDFWTAETDRRYNFIVSFSALHYLSDARIGPFFGEVYQHTAERGMFIAGIGNRSGSPQIAEMEDLFRIQFVYNRLDESRRPTDFQAFHTRFEETDKKANINWHSPQEWLEHIGNAGFREVDIVYHLWLSSIFVALK